eukprot:SAG22_NODE_2281_length_2760_cov_21.201052_3_plen_158_part_00
MPSLSGAVPAAGWPTVLRYRRELELPTPLPPQIPPPGLRVVDAGLRAVAAALASRRAEWAEWAAAILASFGNAGYSEEEVLPTVGEMSDGELEVLMASIQVSTKALSCLSSLVLSSLALCCQRQCLTFPSVLGPRPTTRSAASRLPKPTSRPSLPWP